MKVFVTGGTGYIGSHTVVELIEAGYEVVILDNFSNSKPEVLDHIYEITGVKPKFYEGDCCDKDVLRQIFRENEIDSVIHFAGFKAVGESVQVPLKYYRNNLVSTISLCEVMNEFKCKNIIFSSSATVYGDPKKLPLKEEMELGKTTNPYGTTKAYIERILSDLSFSDKEWKVILLRYFNPVGSHSSGLIGENPNGTPNNLMPYIMKVAVGVLPYLNIFGDDYDTKDGTGVRDYIHVVDLAKGHLKALEHLNDANGVRIYNLGTGTGYSVLEMVQTFERVNNVKVPYKIAPRREGDIATCYADSSLAYEELGWKAELGLEEMVSSAYKFILNEKK